MIHHDARDYDVAVGETARRFQAQLDDSISRTRNSALTVIEKVATEVPTDSVISSKALTFHAVNGDVVLGAKGKADARLRKHALTQLCERAKLPTRYLNHLLTKPYGPELLVKNLTEIFANEEPTNYLVREVNDEVRGVLSSTYRRMDSLEIIEAFGKTCQDIGAVPIEGIGGDLRWAIKAILPKVFQPSQKAGSEELVAFGVQLSNSDYGMGALSVRVFMQRVICTNYATLDEALRQVHLGKRLNDDMQYSAQTLAYDTKTVIGALQDIVRGVLEPARINETVINIGRALEERIDPKQAWQELPKHGLLQNDIQRIQEIFRDGGVEQLPPGTTRARLANAISWFAKTEEPERRLELEQVAGEYILPGGRKSKAAA